MTYKEQCLLQRSTSPKMKIRQDATFDEVSLGEVMLRLDPGDRRIRTARAFDVWEGGGEYNVARGLHKCFGLSTSVITAFADNEVGHLLLDLISQGGVDPRFIKLAKFDGVGRETRNGLNFTERGFGVRGAVGVSDRGHTAVSQLKPADIDWDYIFGELGSKWLHTGEFLLPYHQAHLKLQKSLCKRLENMELKSRMT